MNTKNIKILAEIMKNSDLSVLEISEGENRVRLERNTAVRAAVSSQSAVPSLCEPQQMGTDLEETSAEPVDFNQLTEVKSPMVGVFYSAPAPDVEPFVTIGSKVKKGDVLCIVEAMKLMNEILAESDGEIVDICSKNGEIVEFGQTLFKLF